MLRLILKFVLILGHLPRTDFVLPLFMQQTLTESFLLSAETLVIRGLTKVPALPQILLTHRGKADMQTITQKMRLRRP